MVTGFSTLILHQVVAWLLYPVLAALAFALVTCLWELGHFAGEATGKLKQLPASALDQVNAYADKHLERVDLLARSGPILGLMGTLIPLGPGLSALTDGDISLLASAMMVAFDTTVVGLAIGLVGYLLGRVRRRWYDTVLGQLEQELEQGHVDQTTA